MNNKDWFVLSILTFLTVLTWTVYDIYHTMVSSNIAPVDKKLVQPISSNFDSSILSSLKERE